MCRRVLYKLESHSGAVSLLQRVNKLSMAILVILVDDFELAFELDLWRSRLPLRCGGRVDAVRVGVVRQNECACEENGAGENRTVEDRTVKDPRGTDPDRHGLTFLNAMIVMWTEEREITQVQSQMDIS